MAAGKCPRPETDDAGEDPIKQEQQKERENQPTEGRKKKPTAEPCRKKLDGADKFARRSDFAADTLLSDTRCLNRVSAADGKRIFRLTMIC
ncbi:hypothetical protein QYF36_019951 [Acer negundo]|nr:hypothetical protein QYF36_019951 [Acer negundo]